MARKTATVVAMTSVAAGVAAGTVARRRRSTRDGSGLHGWRVVTVNRSPEQVDRTPEPLAVLGSAVEVHTSAAPGDKGTELRARWRPGAEVPDDGDPLQVLRSALRQSKQLLEVGWVLEPDHNVTTQETPLNAPLRRAVKAARGEGLL
ncbi:hypothetical protein [Cellulomonas sp. URHE0023]|uniref:hypothetical protein n=1 Tax=Cellulomonas sp. URHE0023 TaxID=1380354 RepID=UPI0018CC5B62|nr:hypothetical protein [Cellulomonas sp. URHE0023]